MTTLDLVGRTPLVDLSSQEAIKLRKTYEVRTRGFETLLASLYFASERYALLQEMKNAGLVHEAAILGVAFDGLRAFAVNRPSKQSIGASFTKECTATNTMAVIYYSPKFGAFIDIDLWNKLDSMSQFALIVHEALRNVQIRYRGGFSDAKLQLLTGLLLEKNFEAIKKSAIDKLSVVFAICFALLFLGERITWKIGLGTILIGAGASILAM